MGDYFDMYSDESGAHLAWAATFNGEQDVYYSLITPEVSSISISQDEFMDLFTPGYQIDMVEGESGSLNIGQTGGPNVYDFSFIDLQNPYTVNNYEVSDISVLASRFPSNATVFGENTEYLSGSPIFLSMQDSTFLLGEASIEDQYYFAHYQPGELFSDFPMSYPADFSQDFNIYDTTYNANWQIELTEMTSESVEVTIDGFGTLHVGELTYECLRMKRAYLTEEYKEFLYATKEGLLFVASDVPITEPDTGYVNADYQALLKAEMISNLEEKQKTVSATLSQNYPNPFSSETNIRYFLEENYFVTLKVIDITGRIVAELVSEYKESGNHNITFDASDLQTGVYYFQLRAGDNILTRKMMVLE